MTPSSLESPPGSGSSLPQHKVGDGRFASLCTDSERHGVVHAPELIGPRESQQKRTAPKPLENEGF
jgi:hypothetical protein